MVYEAYGIDGGQRERTIRGGVCGSALCQSTEGARAEGGTRRDLGSGAGEGRSVR